MLGTESNPPILGIELVDFSPGRADNTGSNKADNEMVNETTTGAKEKGEPDKIKDVWSHFSMDTTCHGMKMVGNSTNPIAVRVVFGLVMAVMVCGLGATLSDLYYQRQAKRTVTRTEIFLESSMPFPTITLCNLCPFDFTGKNESDPLYRVVAGLSNYRMLMPEINLTEPAIQEILNKSVDSLLDEYSMILDVKFAEYDGIPLAAEHFEYLDVLYSRCHQFNGPRYVATRGAWQATKFGRDSGFRAIVDIKQSSYGVYGWGRAGIEVFISDAHDSPPTKKNGIHLRPGASSLIGIKTHKRTFLPWPYKSYSDKHCLDVDKDNPELAAKMKYAPFYSYNTCMDECSAYLVGKSCSCYLSNYVIPGLKPCTAYQFLFECYRDVANNLSGDINKYCDCPRPCAITNYDTMLSSSQFPSNVAQKTLMKLLNVTDSSAIRDNILDVHVFFDSSIVTHEKHDPESTLANFFSMLGGQMGLYLGASIITLVEMLEFIRQIIFICIARIIDRFRRGKRASTKQ